MQKMPVNLAELEMWAVTFWQTRREGGVEGVSYTGPRDVWRAPPSARNIKYASIYDFKTRNMS